eukprot:COSAG01_NODE_2911_length_6875_cov_93.023318_2_plen_44_part_00
MCLLRVIRYVRTSCSCFDDDCDFAYIETAFQKVLILIARSRYM